MQANILVSVKTRRAQLTSLDELRADHRLRLYLVHKPSILRLQRDASDSKSLQSLHSVRANPGTILN